ncbi:PREDICTED: purine permease 1-like [Lupinus angustifolius]|uniref:purine permease 1-like n=1 Tax=Lupinus angustifolius TaxID=3871 RepID=UPI00092E8A68|nr:PREDICTED: purine permease 1-like [Lupinus angustifolius]
MATTTAEIVWLRWLLASLGVDQPEPTPISKLKSITLKPPLLVASAILGIITGLDNFLYSYGVARLPVSTSTLIIASQLAFTTIFSFFMVKQKFTPFSVNAILLLTLAAGILALNTNGNRPTGESSKTYMMEFILTIVAAILGSGGFAAILGGATVWVLVEGSSAVVLGGQQCDSFGGGRVFCVLG